MPAQNDTELITYQGWTARMCPALQPPARLLLLLHGFKGDENSMWVFAHGLAPDYYMLAPRAPFQIVDGGFSWQSHQEDASRIQLHPPGEDLRLVPSDDDYMNLLSFEMFEPVLHRLLQFVDSYGASQGVNTAQFDVIGFSQGGTMTGMLTLLYPGRVRKAAILGAFLPKNVEPLLAERPLAGRTLFVAHGTRDEKVPLDLARRSMVLLEQAGARIDYCEDDVGHKVSSGCLRALQSYLRD